MSNKTAAATQILTEKNSEKLKGNEIDEGEHQPTIQHQISRSVVICFIQSLRQQGEEKSFITPDLALRAIDFCHFLVTRTPIQQEDGDRLIHKWYNVKLGEWSSIPFNKRTKTMEEIIDLLIEDCDLETILVDDTPE